MVRHGPAAAGRGRGGVGGAGGGAGASPAPLYDPTHPDAVLLNGEQWAGGEGRLRSGRAVVPVVVDPYLSRHLRPHQREGVRWMYEVVMGLRAPDRSGGILADEMGLGKTLQTLALIWTLMRQGPEGVPVVRKTVVVAPATLVNNWGAEIKKWMGVERMRAMALSSQGAAAEQQVKDFRLGSVWSVLLASYESMRRFGGELAGCCDLLICDEGHRRVFFGRGWRLGMGYGLWLKSAGGNKTIAGLQALNCARRMVLTGTPVQNNLEEFYALLSFATPGVLGPMATFKRVYADPISRSRDKDASQADRELGAARAAELQQQAGGYVLRRTQDVLTRHLPPLQTFTVFVRPSELQVAVYRAVLKSPAMTQLLYGSGAGADGEGVLPAITVLRKLCNHPRLLLAPAGGGNASGASSGTAAAATAALQQALGAAEAPAQPMGQQQQQPAAEAAAPQQHAALDAVGASGKLRCLEALLARVLGAGCRAVVVSTSTATLDMVDAMLCRPQGPPSSRDTTALASTPARSWATARIDGGTGVDERQSVVDGFNQRGVGRVFLLSTRAGGAGLNLVGANHLVLFDSAPASIIPLLLPFSLPVAMDRQAMARIWRDGQRLPCFVYRLLTTGTIEEKIYQRQIMKSDLALVTMEEGGSRGGGGKGLSQAELKQLFRLQVRGRDGG
ncbi:DNA repair and recombination protein RAD54B [Monoraphidium neglectum]|uniref:DNA repair and recombination protein RAD54B n=1 Tax=Monoraphidium neglectum TaxID=145388 RepID=A0A0D2MFU6_9CHLO|nr:DNA repair and recombination protein RAD54B [Monoraphidium neglectum]KIZ01995.1 DNA repair and recombination protein RAD54B [Monoraphidium neglectum]|eukprot:XP_013901014.1 DNA repair and recombination protein RAD54B [Monoraphidium neglectum]